MHGAWYQWIIAILGGVVLFAAAVAAVPTLWRFLKAAARVPAVLEGVASEFAPNGGGSLRDSVNQMGVTMQLQTVAFEQHLLQDEAFVQYTHTRFHDLLNEHQKTLLLLSLPDRRREEVAAELLRGSMHNPEETREDHTG